MTNLAVIAFGSNVGASEQTLLDAKDVLAASEGIELVSFSSIYTSEPAVVLDQPPFKNAVALVQTSLDPHQLLACLQSIEVHFGRVRSGSDYIPSGPRTLDLDIIDYEGVVLHEPQLILPHPQALLRDFVVQPLLEISPYHVLANQKVVTTNEVECGLIMTPSASNENEAFCLGEDLSDESAEGTTLPEDTLEQEGSFASFPSFTSTAKEGTLYICATPIGNMADITLRVIDTLRAATTIYCEDTRVTRKLAQRFNLTAPLKRADAHKIPHLLPTILDELNKGGILAYVSDAGMPGISDPGGLLVAQVRAGGANVEVLPGASALTTALATSGIKSHNHYFGGFFPRKTGAGTRLLQELQTLDDTVLVFYESVHRTVKTLDLIAQILPTRTVVLARELTKLHEEVLKAPAQELAALLHERGARGKTLKGEIVILIAPTESK